MARELLANCLYVQVKRLKFDCVLPDSGLDLPVCVRAKKDRSRVCKGLWWIVILMKNFRKAGIKSVIMGTGMECFSNKKGVKSHGRRSNDRYVGNMLREQVIWSGKTTEAGFFSLIPICRKDYFKEAFPERRNLCAL
jgi:hypothetical protein